ncbi:hypothetical protein SAMN05444972_11917 [Marininema halotolerans]|uniref:Uncharacterized protein n=1 Tax=Marininema halotolerans TaxID=1155944 RepID=A0A1I6UQW8_9BACL|nr:hypothetical protein SAMN05444972_11917 [Marininema halotolerans]
MKITEKEHIDLKYLLELYLIEGIINEKAFQVLHKIASQSST